MQLHREDARIQAAGARLVFVGNGNRHFASAFRDELCITAPIYVDTRREAYAALGMKRSVGSTLLSPDTWKAGLRAFRGGFRQKSVQGDAWQLGGVLVVRRGGTVSYRHLSESAGDHPPVAEVLSALGA